MESHETKSSVESGHQPDNEIILMSSRDVSGHCSPTSVAEGGLVNTNIISGVARSLTVDALAVLDEMRIDCQQPPDLRGNYYKLCYYLNLLKRFCEGRA